ncbi:DUF2142 domain-containing protein [Actinomadura sp. 1N219]|uniref:DUF2142 domain-containing protein n=1 Tax=Actinomadura sp. 1N219 TaxID=3375152 RepID=UPI0037B3CDAB
MKPESVLPERRLRLVALLAFLGFFAVGGGWAIAMPWDGGTDEQPHVTRAAGVVSGGMFAPPEEIRVPNIKDPIPGVFQSVPAGVARQSPACFAFDPKKSAACLEDTATDSPHDQVRVFTYTGRYPPTYSLVVGWPLKWWPSETGLLLARLISAALSAAFLAAAVYSVLAWSRRPFLLAGLLVATTPMTMQLAGMVNPNGLEITASIAMWTAVIPLVLGRGPVDRRLLILFAVSAVTVACIRPAGPMAVAVALAVLLGTAGRARLGGLARDRRVWVAGGVIAAACAASAVWTLVMHATGLVPTPYESGHDAPDALKVIAVWRVAFYWKSMVGIFGWTDVELPDSFYALWFAATGFLLIAALAAGRRSDRLRLGLIVVAAFVLPVVMDTVGSKTMGMMAHGRYILPVAAGAALMAAYTVDRRGLLAPRVAGSAAGWLAVVLLPAHLIGLAWTMVRYQHGLYTWVVPPVNPLSGDWRPPLGSATALVTAVAGLAALGAMVRLANAPATADTAALREGSENDGLRLDRGDAAGHVGNLPRP